MSGQIEKEEEEEARGKWAHLNIEIFPSSTSI